MQVEKITPVEFQCKTKWCKIYNHWLNPFGNWLEPLPYPEKRAKEAEKSKLGPMLYWTLRNPLHNFMNHWIGLIPIGNRYEWSRPEENGWKRVEFEKWSYWKKGIFRLPYFRFDNKITFYIGWTSRGNFGVALRRYID